MTVLPREATEAHLLLVLLSRYLSAAATPVPWPQHVAQKDAKPRCHSSLHASRAFDIAVGGWAAAILRRKASGREALAISAPAGVSRWRMRNPSPWESSRGCPFPV